MALKFDVNIATAAEAVPLSPVFVMAGTDIIVER